MKQIRNHPNADSPALVRAALLCGTVLSSDEQKITTLLDFFAVPWTKTSAAAMESDDNLFAGIDRTNLCVIASATQLVEHVTIDQEFDDHVLRWIGRASSVYVYGFQETSGCSRLLQLLSGDATAKIRRLGTPQTVISVTDSLPELCGPLSGMTFSVKTNENDLVFDVGKGDNCQKVISGNDGETFFEVPYRGIPFYLAAGGEVVDLSAPATKYFDVRKQFSCAVPVVMYVRWAFRDITWTTTETGACLIVDDPLLKPRYGFLDFRKTLESMDKLNFAMTVAFIPWNWRRTNSRTVDMFRLHPEKLSLCVHGCDHTAGELASRSPALLNRRIKSANQRMDLLQGKTSLNHDRVMVFPQGEFSPEIGRALKLNGFDAAVNTEIAPANGAENDTKIADLWSVAIMKYGTFPIFTRRYITHGIENFAFDALLGKPCLIVAHHDVFKGHGQVLADFVAKLNMLKWNIRWRPLGDVIRHGFKLRSEAGTTSIVSMYAEETVIENMSKEAHVAKFMKKEGDLDCVKGVTVNQNAVDYSYDGEYLRFTMKLAPNGTADVRIIYFDKLDVDPSRDGIGYKIKTHTRRYLSELRDNYLSQSSFLLENALRIKRLLK
jgi:hypothetical protein